MPDLIWVAWIIAGAIVGLLVNAVAPGRYRLPVDLLAGIFGGLSGGLIFVLGGAVNALNFSILSTSLALFGALVVLALLRLSGIMRWLSRI